MGEFKKSYPECNIGARRRTRRGGALSPDECVSKKALFTKAGQGIDSLYKSYPECKLGIEERARVGEGRRRKSKKAGRRTRRR